jgi:hypothetical protein
MPGPEMLSPTATTGSPFSASQESHSLQVLGDGTRIERKDTSQYYRDSQGRTRVETGGGEVMIQDPVNGFVATLEPAAKTAQKMPAPQMLKGALHAQTARIVTQEMRDGAAGNVTFTQAVPAGMVAGGAMGQTVMVERPMTARLGSTDAASKPAVEDLGTQNINGVLASGRRTTLTIAAGDIGNDRPIRVVSETWYSSELQMVVKSSNLDPRFGDTTYELTNISRAEPNPGLFQIPADYTQLAPRVMQFSTTRAKE